MKNVDHKNKIFFSDSPPVAWYGFWMIIGLFGITGSYENMIYCFPFVLCLLWSTYRFLTVLYYKKSPELNKDSSKWEQNLEVISDSMIFIIKCTIFIGILMALSSFSIHGLLVFIVLLLLFK